MNKNLTKNWLKQYMLREAKKVQMEILFISPETAGLCKRELREGLRKNCGTLLKN